MRQCGLTGWAEKMYFIYRAGITKKNLEMWQCLHFAGEAKMGVYALRNNKQEDKVLQEAASVQRCNVKCRLTLETN